MWELTYTNQAKRDKKNIERSNLSKVLSELLELLQVNPFTNPPTYEKLSGYANIYSRRINIKHRLVYEIKESDKTVRIISMWGHYDDNG